MANKRKANSLILVLWDFLAAFSSWTGLYLFRKICIEQLPSSLETLLGDNNFVYGAPLISFFWLVLFFVVGTYSDIYRKSRLKTLSSTFFCSLFGSLLLFFSFLLDDKVVGYTNYYQTFLVLFLLQFCLTFLGRCLILTAAKNRLKSGKVGYNTVIIGANERAKKLYEEIGQATPSLGYFIKGFTQVNGKRELDGIIPNLGGVDQLKSIISEHQIEEVIIAIETSEHYKISQILNDLADEKVVIKIIPGMYDILSGSVKMNHVVGAVLIEVYPDIMPKWQKLLKRLIDVSASVLALVALSPLLLYTLIRTYFSSPGPIFYKQERVGLYGRKFKIIKFRSMFVNAEQHGPALSSDKDKRITKWGKTMRKWRLDELPQFINVLKAEMSLVGPRPERQFFIDQIVEKAPHYRHLQRVKPGITSWGMVKFGYAESIDEMIERLKYDVLYIENMSLALDVKIMLYTLLTVLKREGK